MIAERSTSFVSGLGRPTEPDAIEAGLRKLWSENETATRASLMNLAIYSASPGSLEASTQCVYQLTLEHACRVLLIEARHESAEQHTEAWITAHCSLGPDGQKAVCCEQIAFRMHGNSPARLTNLLFAHLESDLPLTLWWQAPFDAYFEPDLYSRVDRLLFDSSTWNDPTSAFEHLLAARPHGAPRFVMHDLNWTRSFQLRLAIAAGFEQPEAMRWLHDLQRIHITHGQGFRSTAELLVGWLMERLETLENPQPEVTLEEVADAVWPVMEIGFFTGSSDKTIRRTAAGFYTWDDGTGGRPRLFPGDPTEPSALLIDQLGRGGNNAAYRRVMKRTLRRFHATKD